MALRPALAAGAVLATNCAALAVVCECRRGQGGHS